jgi:Lon protease-like protein
MSNKFPDIIPIFPLSGVIFFPNSNLPLNIFEQRYLDLVGDAFSKNRLMGLVQSKNIDQQVYKVGCLGKINDYKNSPDGRVLINLVGVTRFEVLDEVTNSKSYREFKVSYKTFDSNLQERVEKISTEGVLLKAKTFFKRNGLLLNWKEFEKLDETQKINTLAMIAPITNEEKQKLLESVSLQDKIKNLDNIINFYLHEIGFGNQTVQ